MNGSAGDRCSREVVVPLNAPITVSLDAPPQGPVVARYATWVWLGSATNSRTLVIGGRTIGCTIDPSPFDGAQSPQAFRCLRGGFGPEYCAGTHELASPPSSAPWMLTRGRGFSRARTFFLQSVIEDNGSANGSGLSVSNAVFLNVH
ncbi:MAG: hypothetical protein HY292_12930 [Planctomycetes bacterium]|nr:hypothetical protein [Planctomycetota bacterium]